MKKYWKLIAITCATVLTLGIFYVKNSTYSESLPQFSLQTMEGDKAIADTLTVYGQKYYGMFDMEEFMVNQEGTNYDRDQPFFKRVEGFRSLPQIDEWRSEYRSFMRGKDEYMGKFYEGNDQLVYASAIPSSPISWTTNTFDIHIADKTTKDIQHFQAQIPNYSTYWDVDIQYVYMIDNELTLITINSYDYDEESSGSDVQRFTFDVETEQLVEEEIIYETTTYNDEDVYGEVTVHSSDQDRDHLFIAEHQIHYNYDEVLEVENFEAVKISGLIKYNVRTNETDTMDKAKEVNGVFTTFDQERLYFADVTSKDVRMIPFNYKEQVVEDAWEVDIPQPEDALWTNYATVQDNKIYFLNEVYDGVHLPTVFVLDVEKQQLVFLGEIVVNDPTFDVDEIYFERLEVQ